MNPDFPQNEREKLERKLTAMLLGELPPHEEAALHRAMDEDPELAGLYERLKVTVELVRSAECGVRSAESEQSAEQGKPSAELKLPAEKREKLLAHFKTVRPKEFVEAPTKRVLFDNRRVRLVEWAAVAAVAVFFAALIVPNFVRTRSTAAKNTIFNNLRLFDGAKQTLALESNLSANRTVNLDEVRPYLGRGSTVITDDFSVVGETYVLGKVGEQPGIEMSVGKAKRIFGKEVVAHGQVHDGRVRLSMDDLLDRPPWADQDKQGAVAVLSHDQLSGYNKGDISVQDASKLLEANREARRTAIAKGEQERRAAAQPLISREQDQTATFGLNSQSASSSAKTEIALPSSNETAVNEQLALNEQRQTAAFAFNGLATNYQVASSTDNWEFPATANLNIGSLSSRTAGTTVTANGGTQPGQGNYRFYLDLDRNGKSVTNSIAGDSEWLGVLETPEQLHTSNSAFVARSASIAGSVYGYSNFAGFDDKTAGEFSKSLAAAGSSNDNYSLQTSYRMLSQLNSGGGQTNLEINYTNLIAGTVRRAEAEIRADEAERLRQANRELSESKAPILGDIPKLGAVIQGELEPIETNGQVYTGLSRDDVSGLRYLPTNGVVASQPIDGNGGTVLTWNSFDGSTNAPVTFSDRLVQNDGDLGVAGTNSFAGRLTLADNSQTAKDTEQTRRVYHGGPLLGPVEAPTPPPIPQPTPKTEIALPPEPSAGVLSAGDVTGGFGGAGSTARLPKPAVGGKQVEMAAARVHRGTPWMTDFKKSADSGSNDFQSSAGKPEGTYRGTVSEAPEIASVEEAVRREKKPQISTAQSVQDGKLLFESGKMDEADAKLKEALARDPNDQAALYYESLIKQNRAKEAIDARNVVGYVSVTNPGQNTLAAASQTWTTETHNKVGAVDSMSENQALQVREQFQTDSDDAKKRVELASAEQKLEAEKHWRDILKMKTGEESVDKELPKAKMVTIVEPATIATTEKVGLGEKLHQMFSGKVERTASITVAQEHPDIAGIEGRPVVYGYDPYFPQTELNVIKSDAVLKKAAEFLNTDRNGGEQVTIAQIKKDLDLHPVKNSKEIEIGARSETADQATRIANAVAAAYRDYRLEQYNEIKGREMEAMQQQMVEQEKKVELAQAKVDELAKESHAAATASSQAVNQSDTALPKPAVPPPTPQQEMLTRENAFSTFSMNVSDVSFKLAAASLEKGQMPEAASIRSEEFINAFDYRDPEAAPGVPVAFNYERALYPFAHNRELLRFSLKTAAAGRQAGRPLNIVLLLDNSGSMERADRVRIIQEALRVLAGQLQAQDTFSIVTFARTPRLRVDGIPGNQAAAAAAEAGKFTPEGGTDLGGALDVAYETALHHYLPNGDNRVVLLTDGAANLGDVDSNSLKQKVETHRKQGIALDCFGIGWEGYNDDLLEVLTRDGDGRYGFINTPEEASTEFVSQIAGALHVAAADVKVQVEFNPDRVVSYRQIGYAKHQLTKEQFRDNTVAAAQIAAQEAGNALYTIEVNPQGQGSIGTVRVRYKVPDTGEVREQSWDVPYTGAAVSMEQASPAMRLATTASAFSEWLATSPFAEEVTTDQLLNYLNGVPQVYGADARPQKLEWMIRQAKSISGK